MGCIAIWCSSDNGQASSHQLEVHFNLWRARKKPLGTTDFLDVGLMLPTGNSADCINIFVPGSISKSNIQDLGSCFQSDINLVAVLFNESWSPIPAVDKALEVQDTNKQGLFHIYMIDKDTGDIVVSKKPAFGGSIVSISVPS